MSEDFEENEHKGAKYLIQLVDRYEQMLADETQYFFDAEELEVIPASGAPVQPAPGV